MTDSPVDQPTAAALAAAAGVAALAAAAEADGPEGEGLLAVLVRHEVALGHLMTMRFAAAGNAALDLAVAQTAHDDVAAKAADRQAARLGAAAARVMGNVRLALRTLGSRAATAAPEEEFIGVRFEGEPVCSPAEAERRLAAARAAAWSRQEATPAVTAPSADAAAQDPVAAAALAAAADLAAEAGIAELARATTEATALKGLLRDELAAAHRLAMRCGGRACWLLEEAQPADDQTEALRLASASARLMARGRQALAALPQLQPSPAGGPTGRPGGGPRRIAGYYWLGEHNLLEVGGQKTEDRRRKVPAGTASAAGPAMMSAPDSFCLPSSVLCRPAPPSVICLPNRGRLRNGNPSGDFLAAPRCGARTRAGCACRQPAMANGRCRFHGGKSTGPRTEAGLAKSRAARRTHGGYSAEIIDLRQAAAAQARRVRALAALGSQKSETGSQKESQSGDRSNPAVLTLPTGTFWLLSSDFCRLNPAGHRVHPLFFMARLAAPERPSARRRAAGSGK